MCCMQQHKLYYLAGLIDGEGCISAYHEKSGYVRIRIAVVNTDRKMIQWIDDNFGGKGRYMHQRRFRQVKWKDCYQWIWNVSRKDKEIIESLIPILITKRKEMEIALEYVLSLGNLGIKGKKATPKTIAKREYFHKRLIELKSHSDND